MDIINRIIYNLTEVHPFHTLVVHFPIALTGAALFFILLALWRRSPFLEQVAFANMTLATVSSLAAGITGLLDNQTVYDGEAPNASIKIILASILFGVTLVVSVARWRQPDLFQSHLRSIYVSGYFISFGLVSILGFLGGVILYGYHEVPEDKANIPVTGGVAQPVQVAAPTETVIPGVSFANDVLPIIKGRCTNCHGGQELEEGLDLTSYAGLMAGSDNGPVLIPGDASNSSFIQLLLENKMPKRGPKLKPEQIQLLTDWVNEGAREN